MVKILVPCSCTVVLACACCLLTSCDAQDKAKQNIVTDKAEAKIVEQSSGLKKEILKEAPAGAKSPQQGKRVTVHYTGWLDDNGKLGQKFDSSVDRGRPFVFIIGVGQVIKGWDEGVMGMKVGEKCRLTIPSHMGYGARGAGAIIPPHATLIFDVELLEVSE